MLALKINNEFVDLPADVALELERNNPFLSDDDIQGEFSLGLTIRYTEKNYRLLQYTGNFYKPNQKYTVDAEIYDAGIFRYAGKLVITQHSSNMNNVEQTIWTGFFTIGSASFMQSIQNVLLSSIDLGGVRSFNFTSTDPADGSGGFWQHVHQTITPNAFPYCFPPISNAGWSRDFTYINWMNMIGQEQNYALSQNAIALCPSIYLSYILERLFANFGWKISGDILNDPGFKKIIIPSFQSIKWTNYRVNVGLIDPITPLPVVTFDLADHVPQDLTVGSFLVSLKNRMGWYFDFDSRTKTAYLNGYQKIISASAKDWTKYVQATYNSDYSESSKKYSLVNNIDANDRFPVIMKIDETEIDRVNTIADLPTPTAGNVGQIDYVFAEDSYYQCQAVGDSDYGWIFYSHNIGDFSQPDADTPIESDISTMPTMQIAWFSGSDKAKVPVCNQPGNYFKGPTEQGWGIRFLFYHGLCAANNGDLYPFASCDNITTTGAKVGITPWSLPYRHEYGTLNDGTYDYWWKAWLKLLSIQDVRTFTLALPITELRNFSFSDIIFINNVFFVVQSAKEMLPYKDLIEMKMKRIY